jgi:ferrochelatase
MSKIAVVLFNSGGPDKLSCVRRFQFNFFYDKAIFDLPNPFRFLLAFFISCAGNKTTLGIYKKIGGKSPILGMSRRQAEALEKKLSFYGDYRVFVCMRYWNPRAKEVVKEISDWGASKIIMLPLYPQYCTTTTQSSFKDFDNELKKQKLILENKNIEIKRISSYCEDKKFIEAKTNLILAKINQAVSKGDKNYRILFYGYGLSQKIVDKGDSYVDEVAKSAKAVIGEIKLKDKYKDCYLDYQICYQSKVGPFGWIEPSLDDEIKRAGNDDIGLIVVPITFTCDNVQTLFDLDIKYKEISRLNKVPFYYRVKALNTDGLFIESLAEMCQI